MVKPGDVVAVVGAGPVGLQRRRAWEAGDLQLQNLWIQNISTSMGLVNANTTRMLLKLVASGRLNVDHFATHHFKLNEMMDAYDTFSRAAETKALKVVIDR